MEEPCGELVNPRNLKNGSNVQSKYYLRRTPARSVSETNNSNPNNLDKVSSPDHSNCSSVSRSEVTDPPRLLEAPPNHPTRHDSLESEQSETGQLPRRYPSRARISAVQNFPTNCGRDSFKKDEKDVTNSSRKRTRKEERICENKEDQEADRRKKVKETLHEFQQIYEKLVQEEEPKKKKEPGERSRFDLVAFKLFKEKNKELNDVSRCLGGVLGVEVGDEFHFRVELFLLGLHRQLQADIDFIKQGERLLAVSIVSLRLGRYNNNVGNSDVLLCCGGGMRNRDQKMESGNLALKNSIDAKTPVRVVHGFKSSARLDGHCRGTNGKTVATYIYGGLYLVEKYWRKKDKHGRYVFMFQLRRLPGQPKLNIRDVTNSSRKITRKEDSTIEIKEDQEAISRKKVKETLHEFQTIYEKLVQEDQFKENKSKKKKPGEQSRFDLVAFKLVKEKNKDLSDVSRCLGGVPGVEVGDEFHFRVELFLLGLHRQLQADIDFIKQGERLLAVSIVSVRLGQYNDNVCNSNILLCCGGGMRNRDQKMEYGNLALKNSIEAKTPVRIVHGFKSSARLDGHCRGTNGKKVATYIYGGLYLVEKYWRKKDKNGCYIFMFQLRRLPGQPKLNIAEVKKSISLRAHSALEDTDDISQGKEKVPIRVLNTIDDEHLMPFEYITEVISPSSYSLSPPEGCGCVKGCSDSVKCACAVKNGGEIPFNSKGAIVEAKPLVYECGPSCKCPPSCNNRVGQHGIKFPLEVFKTESMGWGVRSQKFIPSGSFICEYVGELLDDEEAQKRTNDEYLFAIGNNYYDESLWEGLSTSIPSLQKSASSEVVEDVGFTVDASKYGNVGRFINHSCTPNLYAQNLLYDHDDKRMPHIMLFASEDIPPLQELTYHYNYTIDEVHDSDGNIKKKSCYCGSIECTGRLY